MLLRACSIPGLSLSIALVGSVAACSGPELLASPTIDDDAGVNPPENVDAGADAAAEIPVSTARAAVPLTSCFPKSYMVSATIGGSAFDLTLDTGSTTLGVASSKCTSCVDVSPLYTPGSSATDQGQQATSSYVSGSWTGEIYQDDVALGGQPSVPLKLVSIESHSRFFKTAICNGKAAIGRQGIIGFGLARNALNGTGGYFDAFVAATHAPDIFATELCDSGGTLWLGGYDSTFTTAAPKYTSMTGAGAEYAVNLASITVNGVTAEIGTSAYPDAVVDTGSGAFVVPVAAYKQITAAIGASPAFVKLSSAGAKWFSDMTCTVSPITKAEIDVTFPPLTLTFGTSDPISIQALPSESYLARVEDNWCPALLATDPTPQVGLSSIIGAPVLRSHVVIFDREKKRIGFAPHAPCK